MTLPTLAETLQKMDDQKRQPVDDGCGPGVDPETNANAVRKPQGFATFTPDRLKVVAAMGGKAQRAENRAYSRDRELASRAGKAGAAAKRANHD